MLVSLVILFGLCVGVSGQSSHVVTHFWSNTTTNGTAVCSSPFVAENSYTCMADEVYGQFVWDVPDPIGYGGSLITINISMTTRWSPDSTYFVFFINSQAVLVQDLPAVNFTQQDASCMFSTPVYTIFDRWNRTGYKLGQSNHFEVYSLGARGCLSSVTLDIVGSNASTTRIAPTTTTGRRTTTTTTTTTKTTTTTSFSSSSSTSDATTTTGDGATTGGWQTSTSAAVLTTASVTTTGGDSSSTSGGEPSAMTRVERFINMHFTVLFVVSVTVVVCLWICVFVLRPRKVVRRVELHTTEASSTDI